VSYSKSIGLTASEDRLEKLISLRLAVGADKEEIDARIWDLFGERWAVMFTDLAGFSRGVASFGIVHFLQIIQESQRILIPLIDAHDGILLKSEGDSFLVIFRSVKKAIDCALSMQEEAQIYSNKQEEAEKIKLCVGIGYGDMLRIGDRDVFGSEVNAAAKLGEDIAKAGEILITKSVAQSLSNDFELTPIEEIPAGTSAAFKIIMTNTKA